MDWMDGLMDRASDLLPEVVGLNLNSGETLEQGTEPPTAPQAPQYWLPTALCVCALGWVKCRAQISLLVILSR